MAIALLFGRKGSCGVEQVAWGECDGSFARHGENFGDSSSVWNVAYGWRDRLGFGADVRIV